MDADQTLADSKIAAEDMIKDLESVIDRVRDVFITDMTPEAIQAASIELFRVQFAIGAAHRAAVAAKAELLRAVGMRSYSRLSPGGS